MRWIRFIVIPVLVLSLIALVGFAEESVLLKLDGLAAGSKAPSFKAESLSGSTVDFPADFKGRIVLVDFWATWCPPCRTEIPHLVKAYDKFKGDHFEMIGVSLDKGRNISAEKVKSFCEKNKITWTQVYAEGSAIAQSYGVRGIPAPFLIDGDTGEIVASGGSLKGDRLERTVEKHVKAKETAAQK